jgi:hypothetical protein
MKYLPIPLCAGLAAFFCFFPITDTDIFWHLAAGREIIAHRHFLYSDPFAFTLASPQWIDLHWLFQLLMYGLFVLGGLKAMIVFKLITVAGTVTLLCLTYRNGIFIWACALLSALLFYEARYLVCERPVLITMLCMSAYIFLFERVRQGGNKHQLWFCVPLQVIWTNSQGLYPIGIFIIGAYAIEAMFDARRTVSPSPAGEGWPTPLRRSAMRRREAGVRSDLIPPPPFLPRRVLPRGARREKGALKLFFNAHALIVILCCLSCLANPYGIAGLLLPFKLFSRIAPVAQNLYSLTISENVPLFALTGFEAGYRIAVISTAVAVCALFVVNRKKLRAAHVIMFLGFLFLAVSAVRNVLLYCIAIIPIAGYTVMNAADLRRYALLSRKTRRLAAAGAAAAGLLLIAIPFINHCAVVASCPPHRALSPFRFPEKIADYLKANPVPGTMFNDIRYGGYLMWQLYPQNKVFIDGRLVIRPPRFFAEYLAVCARPELFPYVEKKFNITHAILPSAIFTQYRKLIKWLYESPEWHLEFTDGSSFLLVKNTASQRPAINLADPKAADAIADSICSQWHDAPYVRQEALGYFADMLGYLGFERSVERVKERTSQISPLNPPAKTEDIN